MLPFLKDKQEGSMSSSSPTLTRDSDESEDEDDDFDMMDAIVEDMITAVHKKDKTLLRGALEALVEHIQFEDAMQDSQGQ